MIYFESLKLAGFRNFDDEIIHFVPGTNIVLGQNGHGKSNLLEAIYLICTGRSFRTSHLKELIGFHKEGFYIEAKIYKQEIAHTIKLELYPHKKKLTIDQTHYPHFHPLLGFLPVVIMTPEMKKIIDGGPLERRKFLDFLASQISRPYFESITRYHKAVKQKNAALKQKIACDVWDELIAKEWFFIERFRRDLINDLEAHAAKHLDKYKKLEASLNLSYLNAHKSETPFTSEQQVLDYIKKQKFIERDAQSCLFGPHRDDMGLMLNQKNAATTASEGQKKMLVIALCLASFDMIKDKLGLDPLILIDDYDAHFDNIRKHWVCDQLSNLKQSFLTSPLDELNLQEGTLYIERGCFLKHKPELCLTPL